MLSWFAYVVRLVAALSMLIVAGVVLVVSVDTGKPNAVSYGTAAIMGLAGFFCWPKRPNAWRAEKPSQKQLAYAESLGIAIPRGATKGQVSDMISAITGR
jgi:hypothetical protein